MAKGVKKIKWVEGSIIKNESTHGINARIEADKAAFFAVDEWGVGTTDKDKKKGVTWFLMTSNRKQVLKRVTKPILEKFEVTIPKKHCGPYTYYIEASLSGELDKKKIGMHVSGYCPPKITNIEWSNKNGSAKSGSALMLSDNSAVNIKIETEGLNGNTSLSVEIYKEKTNGLVHTISNVVVVDGVITVSMYNAILWQPNVNNSQETENFYVKLKNPSFGGYVPDGNSNFVSPYGQIGATPQFFTYSPLAPSNQTPLKVGSVKVNYDKLYTCRYDKLMISDKDSNKDSYEIEVYDVKKNKTIPVYETIAGASESSKKEITLSYKGYSLKKCFTNTHKQEVEVWVNGKKHSVEAINGESAKIGLIAESSMALLRASPEAFFIKPDNITNYKVYAKTCVQPSGMLEINVYPNVEREVAFVLTLFKSFNAEINQKFSAREKLTDYNKKQSMQLVRDELEILYNEKGGLGFGLQAKVKVDNTESVIDLGSTRSQIKKLIGFYHTVQEVTSVFDGRGKESSSVAYEKRVLPKVTFDIEPPNVALALRMTNKKVNGNHKVIRQFAGAIALKPIVKFKIGVDLLSLLEYAGVGGKISNFIKEKLEKAYDFTIYIIFECSLEAKAEMSLTYNEIEGFASGARKLQVEAGVAIKGGAKATGKDNMVTVMVPTGDGGHQEVKVEKWKAEASAASSILYTYEINANKKGQYSEHKLEFNGVKATIIVYVIKQGMKYNQSFKREFTIIPKPDTPWYKSDKEYVI